MVTLGPRLITGLGSGSSQHFQLPPRDKVQHQKSLLLGFPAFPDMFGSLLSPAKLVWFFFFFFTLTFFLVGMWALFVVSCFTALQALFSLRFLLKLEESVET